MSEPTIDVRVLLLEGELSLHAVDTTVFAPFVIERFRGAADDAGIELAVLNVTATAQSVQRVRVRLQWDNQNAFIEPVAIQEHVVTEWAALGVACALLPSLLGVRIVSVALTGDSFDYRVSDGVDEWGLEVSGTMAEAEGAIRDRLRLKVRQLHDNPYGIMGYVVVTGFVLLEVLISMPANKHLE